MRLLVAVLTAGGALVVGCPPASAQCLGPAISLKPASAARGGTITVAGERFFVGCNDEVAPGGPSPQPEPADRGIRIELHQGSHSFTLARVDADSSYAFSTSITIPKTAAAGAATIVAVGTNGTPSRPISILGSITALARTGSSSARAAAVGAAVLVIGVWLFLLAEVSQRADSSGGDVLDRRSRCPGRQ